MVRLFVGGLPPGIGPDDLRQRFAPFGEVTECSIAPPKVYNGVAFARDFGHVELQPKDEAALRKCISVYNGCKWKGTVLRCSLAHQHYAEWMRQEREGGAAAGDDGSEGEVREPPCCRRSQQVCSRSHSHSLRDADAPALITHITPPPCCLCRRAPGGGRRWRPAACCACGPPKPQTSSR